MESSLLWKRRHWAWCRVGVSKFTFRPLFSKNPLTVARFVFGSKAGALSNYAMDTWAGFARDPQNYLVKQGWPTYRPGGKIVSIGKGTNNSFMTESASVVDAGCRL